MAERIPDSLIDDILNSTKKYSGINISDENISVADLELILADVKDVIAEKGIEESTEKQPFKAEQKKNDKNKFSFDFSKVEALNDEYEDVSSSEDSDGSQIGFTEDDVEIHIEEETPVQEEETKPVTGQISIEKTRMFNEVEIRSAYNPNISHNLGNKVARATSGDAQPLSTPVMAEEKYRRHFFNKPVQKIENTQEHLAMREGLPQKTIETPGIVLKNRQSSQNTDGFAPVPTLVPAEYEYDQEKTRHLENTPVETPQEDNQIMFEGFRDDEVVFQQSEEQAEAELRENRKVQVKDFVDSDLIFKQDTEEPYVRKKRYDRQKVSVIREYFGPKDESGVRKVFETEKKQTVIKLVFTSVICLVMSILSAVAGTDNGNFEIYGNNEFVYSLFQVVLLTIASAINFGSFASAFNKIKGRVIDIDTVIALSAIAGLFQCLVSFAFTDSVESVASITAGAAVIPMIMKLAGDLIRNKNDSNNFEVITENLENCHSVENIADEDTANEIARGLLLGNPEIKYSSKIGFPQRFIELSRSMDITGSICKITVPLTVGIGVILGIASIILSKNVFVGVSTITGTILMGLPVSAAIVSAINLSATNKFLNESGALINGYSAVEDAVESNGVIIDACDAFEKGGCNIEGMKTYHKMRIDEAILYTASVVIASGGVLADVFEGVIIGKKELLLPVESLAYEEKLGCSCWIHNHRVLVGNRDLLIHHNVEAPDRDFEDKYRANGRNVLYLAIEGKISAMFVVVYKANEETAKYMRELEKDGLTIFFRTADANITEHFLEREFGLPENVVKIINPVAGDMFKKIKNTEKEVSDAKIIHNGSVKSMLSSLHGAFVISSFVNSSRLVQIIATVISIIIVALFTFLKEIVQINVWQIIMYHVIWAVILSVPALTRKK